MIEVFIEMPSNLLARAQTWSNYKHHNTVKFLVGIAPQGTVTFISDAWGGNTRTIANVRIHVERVIVLVRRKYQVLQSRALRIEYMHKKPGESKPLIDKIGVICCALSNLSESVVPLE